LTRRIKFEGEFVGNCECKFYDGTKCVLMSKETARSLMKFIKHEPLSSEDKMHVAAFLLRLEGLTHNGEG